jgi:hypothetical protein
MWCEFTGASSSLLLSESDWASDSDSCNWGGRGMMYEHYWWRAKYVIRVTMMASSSPPVTVARSCGRPHGQCKFQLEISESTDWDQGWNSLYFSFKSVYAITLKLYKCPSRGPCSLKAQGWLDVQGITVTGRLRPRLLIHSHSSPFMPLRSNYISVPVVCGNLNLKSRYHCYRPRRPAVDASWFEISHNARYELRNFSRLRWSVRRDCKCSIL